MRFGGLMIRPIAYRPAEAARELKIGRSTLYRRLKAGDIRASKFGRVTLIPLTELERVLSQVS